MEKKKTYANKNTAVNISLAIANIKHIKNI